MLVIAKSHATLKGIDRKKMIIGTTNLFYTSFVLPDGPSLRNS